MSWVSKAAADVMTFSYHDYQRSLQRSSSYFTRRGWETFTNALNRAKIIEGVKEAKQVVSASPRAAPTLVSQGVFAGKYRWIVRMPAQINYGEESADRIPPNSTVIYEIELKDFGTPNPAQLPPPQ